MDWCEEDFFVVVDVDGEDWYVVEYGDVGCYFVDLESECMF